MDINKELETRRENHKIILENQKMMIEELRESSKNHKKVMSLIETIFFELRLLREKTENMDVNLSSEVKKIHDKADKIDAWAGNLESKLNDVKSEINDVKGRIIIMEENFGRDIGALYDSAEITKRYALEIKEKFDDITETQQKHEFTLKNLSTKALELAS